MVKMSSDKQTATEGRVGIGRTAFSALIVVGLLFASFVMFADSSDAQSASNAEGDTITLGTTSISDLTHDYGRDAKGSYSYSDGTGRLVLYDGFAYKASKPTGISCSVNLEILVIGKCSLYLDTPVNQDRFGIDVGDKDLVIHSLYGGEFTIKMKAGATKISTDIHAHNLTIEEKTTVSLHTEGGNHAMGIECSGSLKVIDSKLKVENVKAVNSHECIKCAGMELTGSSVELTAGSAVNHAFGIKTSGNVVKITNSSLVVSVGDSDYVSGMRVKGLDVSDSVFVVSVGKGGQEPFAVLVDNGGSVSIVHSTMFVKSESAPAFNVSFTINTEEFDSIMASVSDLEHLEDIKDPENPTTTIGTNYKIVSTYVEFPEDVPPKDQSFTTIAIVGVTVAVAMSMFALMIVLISRGRP